MKINKKFGVPNILIVILGIILAVNAIMFVLTLAFRGNGDIGLKLANFLDSVIFIAILLYSIWGYKIPHGNALRYIMLTFAVCTTLKATMFYVMGMEKVVLIGTLCLNLAAVLSAYIGGRLNKIKINLYIGMLITLLIIGQIICYVVALKSVVLIDESSEFALLADITFVGNSLAQWLAINFAYPLWYKKHKEAGQAVN